MIGRRFERWLVFSRGLDYIYPKSGKSSVRWNCICDCGKEKLVHAAHLKNGTSQSCGCLNIERSSTHGLSQTRAYAAWFHMRHRCSGSSEKDFEYYQGKGVTYSDKWETIEGFFDDMGECPPGYELERLDGSLGYSAENCVWADEFTQAQNRKTFKNNTSGKTGVTWSEQRGKWRVILFHNKIKYDGGFYSDFGAAVKAREKLEIEHLGQIKVR